MKKNSTIETLFYRNQQIATVLSGLTNTAIFSANRQPLAQVTTESTSTGLLTTDNNNSVLTISNACGKPVQYSPYGHTPALPSILGYNGERMQMVTLNYLLGNGHRIYSPQLMRFFSPDSASPFGSGGISAYAYCSNDPMNFTDPSGRMRRADRPPMPVPKEYRTARLTEIDQTMATNKKKQSLVQYTVDHANKTIAKSKQELNQVDVRFRVGAYKTSTTTPDIEVAAKQQKIMIEKEIKLHESIVKDQLAYSQQIYKRDLALYQEALLYILPNTPSLGAQHDTVQKKSNATRQGT